LSGACRCPWRRNDGKRLADDVQIHEDARQLGLIELEAEGERVANPGLIVCAAAHAEVPPTITLDFDSQPRLHRVEYGPPD